MRLGEIIVQLGRATQEEIDASLAKQLTLTSHRKLGELLMEEGLLTETQLLEALAQQFNLDLLPEVTETMLDPALIAQLPVDWARTHKVLPIRYQGSVGLLVSDPTCVQVQNDVAFVLGEEITPVLSAQATIAEAIEACYVQRKDSAREFLERLEKPSLDSNIPVARTEDLLRKAHDAPVTHLVNLVLLEAVKAGASRYTYRTF